MELKKLVAVSMAAWGAGASALTLTVETDRALTDSERRMLNGGETALVVMGPGTLTTDGLDAFTGVLTVRAGAAIRIGAADGLGAPGATTVVEDGGTLIVAGAANNTLSLLGRTVQISGTGRDGKGAVCVTGTNQNFLFGKLALTGPATIGGDKSWGSVRAESTLDMGGHELTVAAAVYWRFTAVEKPADIILRSWIDVRDDGAFPKDEVRTIKVMGTGVLSLYGWPRPCPWRVHFAEPTSGSYNIHPGGGTSDDLNVLAGPIVIDAGVTVKFNYQSNADWRMTFAGPVSGAGDIEMKMPGTLRFLSAENSFSGKMSFGNGAVVEAVADGALPVIDGKVTMPTLSATARLRLRCRTAASPDGWTQEHVNQYLASDIRDRCVLDVPVGETFDLGTPTPGSYCAAGGHIAFSGSSDAATPVVLMTNRVGRGTLALDDGAFAFHDATGVAGQLEIGSEVGVLLVARLLFGGGFCGVLSGGATKAATVNVGCRPETVGVVEVADGATVTNAFMCGAVAFADARQMDGTKIAAGVVRQRGGSVVAAGGTAVTLSDNGGYGAYELEEGRLETSHPFSIGGRGGIGIFRQDGGDCRIGAYSISLALGGTGVVYQAGGTLVATDGNIQLGETRYTGFQDTYASFASWTIAGTGQTETREFWGGRHSSLVSCLNLIDGGTLFANNVHKGETGWLPTGSQVSALSGNDFFVNFNGGVFRRRALVNLFNPDCLPTRVTVYPKGAVFQVESAQDEATVHAPLQAPGEGNGVTGVAYPARSDYLGAPFVEIVGDGQGATAVALLDAAAGTVTNVVVTSPGWGYTEATAVFTGGGVKGIETAACSLGDVSGGGLVKRGAGRLTLMAKNSYTGATTIEAGTVVQGVDGAIPADTALVLRQGATLDLNGFATAFSGLGGTGGKVVNGDLALKGALALSARRFVTRETMVIDGTLDLTGVVRLELSEADVLDAAAVQLKPMALLTATSIRYPSPLFAFVGVPKGWDIRCTPTAIRLRRERGFVLCIR